MPESSPKDRTTLLAPMPLAANPALAMVVGNSPVNRVVVSRIAERAGLKVLSETPAAAADVLLAQRPATVILDGGPDDSDCDMLMEQLASQRLANKGRAPLVILLSSRIHQPGARSGGGIIDAVVTKPVMPDRLQPLILDMIDRLRDD